MNRPPVIDLAVRLSWLSLLIGVIFALCEAPSIAIKANGTAVLVATAVGIVATGLAIFGIGKGRNWARMLFVCLYVLSIRGTALRLDDILLEPTIFIALKIIFFLVDSYVLFLIYSKPGALWFQPANKNVSNLDAKGRGLVSIFEDLELKLIGLGIAGILYFVVIFVTELSHRPPPDITQLQRYSGQLVEQHISQDRSRIFAEIRVRNDVQDVILFQQVSKQVSSEIQNLTPGMTVTALIVPKDFIDRRTGLVRHKMWQLAINEQEKISYSATTQLINNQARHWQIVANWCGAFAFTCFFLAGVRRLRQRYNRA